MPPPIIPNNPNPHISPVNLGVVSFLPANNINEIIITKPTMQAGIVTNLFGVLANGLLDKFINEGLLNGLSALETEQNIDGLIQSGKVDKRSSDNTITDHAVYDLLYKDPNPEFLPDAIPNGKGGYTTSKTGFWNGRLSSVTGLPVMTSISFIGTTYTSLSGQQITIPTITFEMVIITMKKGRNIEKTNITGRDSGSVKEYIGAKDWEIEIRAVIMASQNVSEGMDKFYQDGKYPEENMEIIDLMLNAPIAIKVVCPYMNNRGVKYIVIDDGVQINQVEGEYEAQRLIIPCVSDSPLALLVSTQP